MAYLATIPQPTDRIKDSQPQILANFTEIPALLEINHVGFTGGADDGKHIKVDFTNSTTHPLVDAGQVLLYDFVNPTTTVNELYVKKAGALGVAGIPFTASSQSTAGYTYLPSGLLIRWGTTTIVGDTTITINAAPKFTAVYNVQLTGRTNDILDNNKVSVLKTWALSGAGVLTLNVAGVQRLSNIVASVSCNWMVIGV